MLVQLGNIEIDKCLNAIVDIPRYNGRLGKGFKTAEGLDELGYSSADRNAPPANMHPLDVMLVSMPTIKGSFSKRSTHFWYSGSREENPAG